MLMKNMLPQCSVENVFGVVKIIMQFHLMKPSFASEKCFYQIRIEDNMAVVHLKKKKAIRRGHPNILWLLIRMKNLLALQANLPNCSIVSAGD